jgi:hypothetical protein
VRPLVGLEQLVREWAKARQAIFDVDPGLWSTPEAQRGAYAHLWNTLSHAENRLMDKARTLDGW